MKISELMQNLCGMYPRQFSNDKVIETWGAEYRRILGGFEGIRLHEAWNALMASWDKATFPRPADILRHIKRDPRDQPSTKRHESPSAIEAEKWASHVMGGPAGQQAIRQGFARELWLWSRENPQVEPTGRDLDRMQRSTDEFRFMLDDVRNDRAMSQPVRLQLVSLGERMEDQERRIAERFSNQNAA